MLYSVHYVVDTPTDSLVHTFNVSSFITTYFPIPFFAVLFFGYKFTQKSKIIDYKDMDFVSGSSIQIPKEVSKRKSTSFNIYRELQTNNIRPAKSRGGSRLLITLKYCRSVEGE